jgi:hypothetical protein
LSQCAALCRLIISKAHKLYVLSADDQVDEPVHVTEGIQPAEVCKAITEFLVRHHRVVLTDLHKLSAGLNVTVRGLRN